VVKASGSGNADMPGAGGPSRPATGQAADLAIDVILERKGLDVPSSTSRSARISATRW
jgi:hypothetical protein